MQTQESRLKDKIKRYLDQLGAYWYMPVPGGYGKQTVDFLCCLSNECHRGRFVAIETKAEGKVPTPRQQACLKEVEKAGGVAFWCDNWEGFLLEMSRHNLVRGQFVRKEGES